MSKINKQKKIGDSRTKYILIAEEMLRDNYTSPDIYQRIRNVRKEEGKRNLSDIDLSVIVTEGLRIIKQEYSKQKEEVISLHVARYNKTIHSLRNIDDILSDEDSNKYITKKTRALHLLLDTLFQKERVLGIHKRGFRIEINNELIVDKREEKLDANLNALSFDEQVELLELIQKSKIDNNNLLDIMPTSEIEVIDVPHEEVKDNEDDDVNINRIKTIKKVVENKQEDSRVVEDVYIKMRKSLLKIAKETLKNKGAKLDKYEEAVGKL